MNKHDLIQHLAMTQHVEGGYFAETYRGSQSLTTERVGGERNLLTSIFYMLTDDRPIGYFHMNTSDIVHYYQSGAPLTYLVIHPDGRLERTILGPDPTQGHVMQLIVAGGCWKATVLESGEYGLLGEAVSPGFDYRDMRIANPKEMKAAFPELWPDIERYVKQTH